VVRGYGNVVFYGSACGAGLVNRGAGSVGFHSFCLVCGRVRVAVAGGMPPWCGIGGFVARGSGLCALVGWSGVVSGYGARLLRVPVSGRMWERPCSSVFVWPRYVPVCGFDLFGRAGARVCAPHAGNGGMPVRGADYMPLYLFSALPAYGGAYARREQAARSFWYRPVGLACGSGPPFSLPGGESPYPPRQNDMRRYPLRRQEFRRTMASSGIPDAGPRLASRIRETGVFVRNPGC